MVCSLHSVTTGSRDRANVPLIIIIIIIIIIPSGGLFVQLKKRSGPRDSNRRKISTMYRPVRAGNPSRPTEFTGTSCRERPRDTPLSP